ncbi:MAG: dihydrodipicolinate reductase, partial [Planctomycetota bacterium]
MNRVAVIGLGPIGLTAARVVQLDPHLHLHTLIDTDASLVGTEPLIDGPAVQSSDASLADCDVALVCTGSSFVDLEPTLRRCIENGTHVVSSCEEMLWPAYRHGPLAEAMDHAAIEAGVALLGTGVNPGFVMDYLPLVASTAVPEVTRVQVLRRVNAGGRRKPLQAKVGATLTVEEFEQRRAAGTIGHRGMAESVAMVCAGLGHTATPGSIEETLDPVVAEHELHSSLGTIEIGA